MVLTILSVMVLENVSYQDCMEAYADYVGWSPERVNAEVCYCCLAAGQERHPREILTGIAQEWRKEHENGILIAQRG